MPRRTIAPDRSVTSNYPISTVLKVMEQTGRTITRSNFHESRRRGFIHPVTKERGRVGDGYDVVAMCQVALFFDLTQKLKLHQQACSDIAYSPESKHFIDEAVKYAREHRHWLDDNTLIRMRAISPPFEEMDICFFWDLEWNVEVEYLRGAGDLLRLQERRKTSRMTLLVNALNLAWEVVSAIDEGA
jgi:hypothetical protein